LQILKHILDEPDAQARNQSINPSLAQRVIVRNEYLMGEACRLKGDPLLNIEAHIAISVWAPRKVVLEWFEYQKSFPVGTIAARSVVPRGHWSILFTVFDVFSETQRSPR